MAVTRLAAPSHEGLQYSTEASATAMEAPAVVGRVVVKASPMIARRLCQSTAVTRLARRLCQSTAVTRLAATSHE
jgi:hypothetical protein